MQSDPPRHQSAPDQTGADGMWVEADTPATEYVVDHAIPAHLHGGEIVILAIKPSLWFILFTSARWLAVMVLLCTVGVRLNTWSGYMVSNQSLVKIAMAVAVVRLALSTLEWASRLYVLTDRRIMRFRGILNVEMFECPLIKIQNTHLTLAIYERLVGLGTIYFSTAGTGQIETVWRYINRPLEIHEQVREAIRRANNHHGAPPDP